MEVYKMPVTPDYEGEQNANMMSTVMIHRDEHHRTASAKKVILVDESGNPIDPESTAETKVVIYGSSVVGTGATVTLATYTVPAGKRFIFKGGIIGGSEAGEFTFEINSNTYALVRNSGSIRTIVATFPVPPEASAAAIVDINVKNIGNKTRQFEATLNGYTIDAS